MKSKSFKSDLGYDGFCIVDSSEGNTVCTLVDLSGTTLGTVTGGMDGAHKKSRRLGSAILDRSIGLGLRARKEGMKRVILRASGHGVGYKGVVKGFSKVGVKIRGVFFHEKEQYGGCRLRKRPRK